MLLFFDEDHKNHLKYATDVSAEVLREFCRISVEFIRSGVNTKHYAGASQKLGVDVQTVQHCIEGLMYLFSESSKLMISEIDFHDSIMTLGFGDDLIQLLVEIYMSNRDDIRGILSCMNMELPHYKNLEWRLDIQLASRNLRHQVSPKILLQLVTEQYGKEDVKLMETDPVNLVHLTNVLDSALQEIKTTHCRRIVKNIR